MRNIIIALILLLIVTLASCLPPPSGFDPEPVPDDPEEWFFCAVERNFCGFDGTAVVRYGLDESFFYQVHTGGVMCNNTVFGDPLKGVTKECYYSYNADVELTPPPEDPIVVPEEWFFCAVERNFCGFDGTAVVRYGLDESFFYQVHTGGVMCNNTVFGDPLKGVTKECYYSYNADVELTPPPESPSPPDDPGTTFEQKIGKLNTPYMEWEVHNPSYSGNPFDLIAWVTFRHTISGQEIRTQMFYDGNDKWKFRFTGTKTGDWTFSTASTDNELNGLTGSVRIDIQPDKTLGRGFITDKNAPYWTWSDNSAFIPRIVMYRTPIFFYNQPSKIDNDLVLWFDNHGMNGLHVKLFAAWYDIDSSGRYDYIKVDDYRSPELSPDIRTFEALDQIILKAYEKGGFIHLWAWGKGRQSPTAYYGGINGVVDRRLQRYISARLGPLPGWTMGYGWDIWDYTDASKLEAWHDYIHEHSGWDHVLGARGHRNDETPVWQMTSKLDYIGHEDHATINYDSKIAYDRFLQWYSFRPNMLHFSEDRFRFWNYHYPSRNFDTDRARKTLWHTAMVGGVATIWGKADSNNNFNEEGSFPFDTNARIQFKIFSEFWKDRYVLGLQRANALTSNGYVLKNSQNTQYIFYKENTNSIRLDLRGMSSSRTAIAVDTKAGSYNEINIGTLSNTDQTWNAPKTSDWAIYIG